jgi:general secretion pathway protein F
MPVFSYRAYDNSGTIIEGEIDAQHINGAIAQIKLDKLKPVSVAPMVETKDTSFSLLSKSSVTTDDIEFITAELSLLLKSSVKIDKSLAVLASAKSTGPLADLLRTLSSDVRHGLPLSDALAKHPKIFDNLYVNLVKIGESSGNLSTVFAGLAKDLKYKKELRKKILQATTYPAVIFAVCICSVLFIFNFVVPKLTVMFNDVAELPLYTQILLNVSDWIQNYQLYLAASIFLLIFALKWAVEQGHFEHQFDDAILKLPVLKNSVTLIERIRFSSSMSLMLSSGVKLDQALVLSTGSIKNSVISRTLTNVNTKVRKGEPISSSLKKSRLFSNLFISLLEVGEESGQMAPVFEEISSRSRDEFSNWTDRMTSLIEPIMILFMGGIVGSVVVVMLMSIVSVNEIGF